MLKRVIIFVMIGLTSVDVLTSNIYAELYEKEIKKYIVTLANNGSFYYSHIDIPDVVMKRLYELGLKEPVFADPGEKFQAGDVVREEGLPWRQIMAVIKDEQNDCILIYYHGGFYFHKHVLFFETKEGRIPDFWIIEVAGNKPQEIIQNLRESNFNLKLYKGEIPAVCQH